MDSPNESFTISSKQALIEDHQPQQPSSKHTATTRSYRKTITVASLVLLTIIATSRVLYFVCIREKDPPNKYLSNASKFYCHVTAYPDLCYESLSSAINSTSLVVENPTRIFSSSIQVCISEVRKTSLALNEMKSINASGLDRCEKWMHSSLNLLTKTFDMLGNDSDIESLTFGEMSNARAYLRVAASYATKCLSALGDRSDAAGGGVKSSWGVDEVKSGVERARKCMVNGFMLWRERVSILDEFYNPYAIVVDDYYPYYEFGFHIFSYGFLVCMYAVMYLFLALLYYLFWHSK